MTDKVTRERGRRAELTVALCAVVITSCSNVEARSAERFCSTMLAEKSRIRAQFDALADSNTGDNFLDVIGGLSASIQAIGELRTYFNKLAAVAPDEIRHEAEIVAQQYDHQLENVQNAMSNPLDAAVSAVVGSITISGQVNSLDRFARQHCGESI